ncbi:MAG: tRNA lysidine(34) synthetase TilS [Sphingomonas sp.]|uniref:tRNA lysidine(34) synthetase TilS n=1 Tax=Sphingomonas sp. TaxID=28214 RepID=UPI002601450A|nr:tRNA lysidine(34) synthetase TilS [Sphingomonas sp.]MBX3565507.1 tRNA lysidine(34) synthetase TilS [Sphingomonas sp.]
MTLDPEAIERFRRDTAALLGGLPQAGRPLALAVSGGADSMAMLALAHAAFPGAVIAATVDHRLRAAAAAEARMVAEHCHQLGVPHAILHPVSPIGGSSIQARAREARYALLQHWALAAGAAALCTAHHVEDQAETFLMRAARGAGLAGLAGIRARRALAGGDGTLALIRPLLQWRRAELRAIAANGPFVDDPSNIDPAHDRSRFRQLLDASPDLDPAHLAATASYAAEAQQALEDVTELLWKNRANLAHGRVEIELGDLNRELRRRLARRAIGHILARPFDGTAIEPLLDAIAAGRGATQAGVMVSVRGAAAIFAPAPPRRSH